MAHKMTNEQFQEEFGRLDEELRNLQHELHDTLTMNDEFVRGIEEKEADLLQKEARMVLLKEKNLAELQQFELEKEASNENYRHEVLYHTNLLEDMQQQHERFMELEASNERLIQSIRYLTEQMNEDNREHAMVLHRENKSMKELRQQMEIKLRRELNGLNISYQKDAFGGIVLCVCLTLDLLELIYSWSSNHHHRHHYSFAGLSEEGDV